MIKSLDELRKLAVKHILRKGPADYLLRHSLCRPWVASQYLDEMAWTDHKSLFFNFPKLSAQLDTATRTSTKPLDPGDHTNAFLAATCHELLHVLWLHGYRGIGKSHHAWRAACEYAINYELGKIFGISWIEHLGVMYPNNALLLELGHRILSPTTENFYLVLCEQEKYMDFVPDDIGCKFCDRAKEEEGETKTDAKDLVRVLHQLPFESAERQEILKFLTSEQVKPQKIPWEMLLLGGIENAINQEQSWALPSRRNDLMPGWRHEKLLSFVWVLDVSPSIDDEMKQSFMNTLQAGINLYHDAQHRVIFFADGIVSDIMLSSGTNLSRMEIPYGSGTDLDEVWEVLEHDMPEYALVLTDLELDPVPKPSFTKVIWGIVGNQRMFDPDYGTKIVLK